MAKKNVAAKQSESFRAATSRQQSPPPPVTYTSAMDKLRDEMAKSTGRYVQVVGEFLTDYLLDHPEAEAAILAKGKTIRGSLDAMRKEAQKHKEGNMAVLDDQTAFGIVLGYFGIKTKKNVPKVEQDVSTRSGDRSGGNLPPPSPDPFDLDALLASGIAGLSPSEPEDSPGETRDAKRGVSGGG